MDISLIRTLTGLKFSVHVSKTHMEGSVSQNVDKRLTVILLYEEDGTLKKKMKHYQKLPVSCSEMKTRT